jgi:3-hydroxyisobutyrate dehydrogenase
MVEGYETPIGAISTMLKDLDTALDRARETNSPLPMASHAQQLLRLMVARGLGEDDPAALVRLYRPTA